MILYHGSNMDFGDIDMQKCQPNKDFGCGFYLTNIEQQAKEMAARRIKIVKKRNSHSTCILF